jgi:stage III sporulation protein AD
VEILRIAALGITGAVLAVLVKNSRPEIGALASLMAGVALIFMIIPRFGSIIEKLSDMGRMLNLPLGALKAVLKIIIVAHITEFGSALCRDCGETSIAGRLELAGKIILAGMSLPIIESLIGIIRELVFA